MKLKKENNQTEKPETKAFAAVATLDKKIETSDAETQVNVILTSIETNIDKEDFNDISRDKLDISNNKILPKENDTILEMGLNHEDLDETKVEKYISKQLKLSLIGKPWIANNGRHYVSIGFKTKTSDFETLKRNTVNWHDSGRIRSVAFSRRHQ